MNDGSDLSAGLASATLIAAITFHDLHVFPLVLAGLILLVTVVFFGYRAAVRSSGQPQIRTPQTDATAAFTAEDTP